MTPKTEGTYPGEFIDSEASGTRSRDEITVASGQNVVAGQIAAKLRGSASAEADAGNTGDGAMGAITVGVGAKVGDYVLTFIEPDTNVGDFIVEDPEGINVGSGAVAAAFSGGGLSFTLADGATDFAAGDRIVITVAAGDDEYVAFDQDLTDGSEVPVGIFYGNYDASDAAVSGVLVSRDCEANGNDLTWPSDILDAEKTAAEATLKTLGIIVRY